MEELLQRTMCITPNPPSPYLSYPLSYIKLRGRDRLSCRGHAQNHPPSVSSAVLYTIHTGSLRDTRGTEQNRMNMIVAARYQAPLCRHNAIYYHNLLSRLTRAQLGGASVADAAPGWLLVHLEESFLVCSLPRDSPSGISSLITLAFRNVSLRTASPDSRDTSRHGGATRRDAN